MQQNEIRQLVGASSVDPMMALNLSLIAYDKVVIASPRTHAIV